MYLANHIYPVLYKHTDVINPNQKKHIQENAILQATQQMVLDRFNHKHDPRLVYHNYHQTLAVVETIQELGATEKASEETIEIAQLAAWFVNLGYLVNYEQPSDASIEILSHFLEINNYPLPLQDRVVQCLTVLQSKKKPTQLEQRLLLDALNINILKGHQENKNAFLRLEEELVQQRRSSNVDWAQLQLQQLMQTKFYLPSAKNENQPLVAQAILKQKQAVEKISTTSYNDPIDANSRKFQGIEKKVPTSATQTFFRTNYRTHINLSAIADNKANIMISVNAIIISVLISMLSYGNIIETRPMILMPVVIFLISGLTSLIFAVLSARPSVTSLHKSNTSADEAKRNIVFFGNFVKLDLEQYEEAMDAMFRSSELIYGNMTRDLYHLGKVLDQKYRYLNISYTVFMIGFIATVMTFLGAIFL